MNRGTRILIVDDEPAIRRTLRTNLTARGYDVVEAETGEQAVQQTFDLAPDLVLLDLMLPDMSGMEVCSAIRAESSVPILILSARGEERAKVRALDLGADDYVTKPFGMDELLARARALLRRPSNTALAGGSLEVGALRVNLDTREVWHQERSLDLTARELDVLVFLMRNAGKVTTHRQLLADVWGPEYSAETQYLRVFVNRLRGKIESDPTHPRIILTEPGVGYRLQVV